MLSENLSGYRIECVLTYREVKKIIVDTALKYKEDNLFITSDVKMDGNWKNDNMTN